MKLGAAIAGVIGVTAVAGTLVFNTDAAKAVKENIEELKAKIVAFADNDELLTAKYDKLKTDADTKITDLLTKKTNLEKEKVNLETKIVDLETKKTDLETEIATLKQDAEVSADKIADLTAEKEQVDRELALAKEELEVATDEMVSLERELALAKEELEVATDEMRRLEKEVEKANKEIRELEDLSTDAVNKANEYKMADVDSLPFLDLATVETHFYAGYTQVDITLKEDIDLGIETSNKGNIEIKFKDAKGRTLSKNKTFAGYLNDSDKNKYGKGTNFPKNDYTNELFAGNKYHTTLSEKNKPLLSNIDPTNIVEVIVTVTNNDNTNKQELEFYNK